MCCNQRERKYLFVIEILEMVLIKLLRDDGEGKCGSQPLRTGMKEFCLPLKWLSLSRWHLESEIPWIHNLKFHKLSRNFPWKEGIGGVEEGWGVVYGSLSINYEFWSFSVSKLLRKPTLFKNIFLLQNFLNFLVSSLVCYFFVKVFVDPRKFST